MSPNFVSSRWNSRASHSLFVYTNLFMYGRWGSRGRFPLLFCVSEKRPRRREACGKIPRLWYWAWLSALGRWVYLYTENACFLWTHIHTEMRLSNEFAIEKINSGVRELLHGILQFCTLWASAQSSWSLKPAAPFYAERRNIKDDVTTVLQRHAAMFG